MEQTLPLCTFLGRFTGEDCVAVFAAYFDESGTGGDSAAISVAGWISPLDQWQRFEEEWSRVLTEYSVSRFHMREFAHCQGEFRDWKGDEPRRRHFLERLIRIIARRCERGFSAAVPMADYRAIDALYPVHERFGHPFPLCAGNCITLAMAWLKERSATQAEFLFEAGGPHRGQLLDLFQLAESPQIKFGFAPKSMHLEFQAADLAAYEILKLITDMATERLRGAWDIRMPFQLLADRPVSWKVFTREALLLWCKSYGLEPRA